MFLIDDLRNINNWQNRRVGHFPDSVNSKNNKVKQLMLVPKFHFTPGIVCFKMLKSSQERRVQTFHCVCATGYVARPINRNATFHRRRRRRSDVN